MYRASCNILYYNSTYHGTVVTNCQWFIVTTEALHYRTGQMTGMGFCSINLMYVISGIVKVLAVSVSLKRQIPTRPRLLCSSYPSGTATDRVGYFGTVLNVRVLYLFEIPEEYAPKWEFLAKFYATGYGSQCDP